MKNIKIQIPRWLIVATISVFFFSFNPLSYLSSLSFYNFIPLLHADVVTDGSVGSTQTLKGPDYAIPETLGTVKGQNLFHSFEKFSIKKEESATFTGPDSIQNVISRVTGGDSSTIDGKLRSEVGKANFYFINPNGVMFGPNAKVDVPAAFHVSTTGELKFSDGSSFKASKTETSTLTQASPESFGFLGAQSATIEINGSTLLFAPESKISLTSSKNITITGTEDKLTGLVNPASLVSDGGEISLTAKKDLSMNGAKVDTSGNGAGKVFLTADNVNITNNSTLSSDNTGNMNTDTGGIEIVADNNLELTQGSRIQSNVSESGDSGTIRVQAENLLIKQQEGEDLTGILIEVEPAATGNGKSIDVNVKNRLKIEGVAGIASSTSGFGDAASVNVAAGQLQIDGKGRDLLYRETNYVAGIASNALANSYGNTSAVSVYVDKLLEMAGGCGISSYSSGMGGGSNVNIKAGEMKVDGSTTNKYLTIIATSSGAEGKSVKTNIQVDGQLELLNGAQIYSETSLKGDAGEVEITAGELRIDNKGLAEKYTGVWSDSYFGSGNGGKINIAVTGLMELLNGANISSSTWSEGDAGEISINAQNFKIDNQGIDNQYTGIWSDSNPLSEGDAGTVEVVVSENLELLNGAQISSTTYSQGNAGTINISASGTLEVINGAKISSETYSQGSAGSLKISAGQIRLDGKGSSKTTGILNTNYDSDDKNNNIVKNSVEIEIEADDLIEILNGAQIMGISLSTEDSSNIKLTAKGLTIDGQGNNYQLTGIKSDNYSDFGSKAGNIFIKVDGLTQILDGSQISSSTTSKGNAGDLRIIADNLIINDKGNKQFTGIFSDTNFNEGNAGAIAIEVKEQCQLLNGAWISNNTTSKGNAGSLNITAKNLKLDGQDTIILSGTFFNDGNAGTIDIKVPELFEIVNSATISSNTSSQGNAGDILIDTNILIADSGYIESASSEDSTGYVGTININANSIKMINNSKIDIMGLQTISEEPLANIPDKSIIVKSKEFMIDGSYISSMSTQNVPASSINLQTDKLIVSNNAVISSGANVADGGDIDIQGGNIFLYDSLITTSVKGENGDGGDITINERSPYETFSDGFLIMQGGFIQANTAGKGNSGGEIDINVKGVIADKTQELNIGGNERQQFDPDKNVIQSAAPDGDPGEINISGLQLDISGSVMNMSAQFSDELHLATDICQNMGTEKASSLINGTRGDFPEMPSDLSSISFDGKRLDELLLYKNSN